MCVKCNANLSKIKQKQGYGINIQIKHNINTQH